MSNVNIDIKKILADSKETLLNPKGYFSSLPLTGGFTEPLIKVVIYGTVAGLFALLWSVTGLSVMGGMGGILGGAEGIMALIGSVIGAIIGLFVGGAILLALSAICGGNTDFEANLRVAASLAVVYPIQAFLAFFYGISLTLGSIVGAVVGLYAIYLLYISLVNALKGKDSSARIVALVLVVLVVIGIFAGRRSSKAVRNYQEMMEEMQKEQVD
jgi:hypothetical protein